MTAATANHHSDVALGSVRWDAVNTLPRREFRAQHQLKNQGFRVFLPQRLKTVRHARKLTNVQAPFFPRYISSSSTSWSTAGAASMAPSACEALSCKARCLSGFLVASSKP